MTIDKQKLQVLLWAEVAAWKADCEEWKQNAEALGEFLGEKTVEEVALELLAENEALRAKLESPDPILIKCLDAAIAEQEQLVRDAERYRWLREETSAGPNIQVSEWVGPHEYPLNGVGLDSAIDAALGKAVKQ